MSDIDHYDVERMIRDAMVSLRAELHETERELRAEIGEERVERQDAIDSLGRVLDSRTERFV